MRKLGVIMAIVVWVSCAQAGFSIFEVKDFEVVNDTKIKAEKAYKGFVVAHAKGIENSKMRIKLKSDKDRNMVLSGKYGCFSADQSVAFIYQGTVDVKFKDNKVKFSFEKGSMAGAFDGVDEKSPDDKKLEIAKKCVEPMLAEYLKGINTKSEW